MGNLRPVLIVGLAFLGYMIWVQWQQDYGPAPQVAAPQTQIQSDTPAVPSTPAERSASAVDLEAPDFDTDFSPLDETGLKPQISGEEAGVELDSDDESFAEDEAVKDVLDVEPTAQMPNVDLESLSGDTAEQPQVDDTAEQPAMETETS